MAGSIVDGRVGPVTGAAGQNLDLRQSRTGSLIVDSLHGRYHETTSLGNVYSAAITASGGAPGTAGGTTPPFTLWNPAGSGSRVSVLFNSATMVSGTIGLGSPAYFSVTQATKPTPGTA